MPLQKDLTFFFPEIFILRFYFGPEITSQFYILQVPEHFGKAPVHPPSSIFKIWIFKWMKFDFVLHML